MNHREDYLRTIYRLTEEGEGKTTTSEVSRELDISDASTSETIQKLEEEDLVCRAPYQGFTLSPPGKELGKESQMKFSRLKQVFKELELENPEEEADRVEHSISDTAADKIFSEILEK